MSVEKIVELQKKAQGLKLLYAEDNKNLQQQALKVFTKIFSDVFVCGNAQEGVELFKKHLPEVVITDINMPGISGIEMAKRIKKIEPFTKVIITSAFDDKEHLFGAIDANVSKYLKKPISVSVLVDAIEHVVDEVLFEKNKDMFEHYVRDVFQYQDTMLILVKGQEVLIVNKKCLEFFQKGSLEEFREIFADFGKLFLKHNNFLYNYEGMEWLKSAKESNSKLFNVKMADSEGESRHFILKAYKIPKKEDTFILSFDDITELNLLIVYDKGAVQKEKQENQKKIIHNIFEIIKRNNSNIRIYNSYKGLNISNVGTLADVNQDGSIVLQTQYLQQRAIKINNYLILESELFPAAVFCEVVNVDFEKGEVLLKNYKFIDNKPSEQEFTRVEPEEKHQITLFFEGRKIVIESRLVNVSVGGAKIVLSYLPAGFKEQSEIVVDMVFYIETKPLIVNIKAKVKNIIEQKKEFEVIVLFDEDRGAKHLLTDYVASRQMALIREFKKL
ncbi:MAG: response regulator transcription factor [Sulfurimonas sp.]|uniref:response regulator n=1 Tax=Sulfurimonas sp. TaxID=2022749 RepID=UPI002635F08E|nr:response regulator transcription factor [Sulfurimonas sp.]MDD2652168.1 response regulator transcription factor [Sulfurimonas sp.]MDD3450549.1 response regulator transcription factor [Sulfurimonas sp.]